MNNYYLRPSELYEWTLNNLHTLPDEAQNSILENLKHLKWVSEMLAKLSPYQREALKLELLNQLEDESFPFCPMSITCIMYNLKLRGVDTSDLETLINTSEKISNKFVTLYNQLSQH